MSGEPETQRVKREIIWQNVLVFIYLHMSALYGLFILFSHAKFATGLFTIFLTLFSMLSVTLGCHRLWAHRTYKAHPTLKFFYILGHTMMCQGSVYDWILDHRIHHRYHGTELDPYNYKRGFLFSQLGCRMVTRNPEIEKIKRNIDMTDIEEDSMIMWQKTLYWFIMPIFALILPINAPIEYWNESATISIFVVGFLRIAICLHCAWLINSSILLWGLDPLDRRSAETSMIFLVNKSLWPNYHYLIPNDYKSGEYGNYGDGFCNAMLRVFTALGWCYSLRTLDTEGLRRALYQASKTGESVIDYLRKSETYHSVEDVMSTRDKARLEE